ncbi:MAG: hypothetical protein JOY68_06445 [Candidatus Dormibacteraeota bacterium]|nr:hypothetical protein [Candidatus Dormibacteraeota bacterium]
MLAHVLTGSPIPGAVQWLVAAALFAGLVGALALKTPVQRRTAGVVAALGFVGTVISWVFAAVQPGPPPYLVRIESPSNHATVSQLVTLTVCGVLGDGTLVPATDSQHYLVVFVDGAEVPTVDAWQFSEVLRPGAHTLKVELVTPQHHAYSPPATSSVQVTASAGAPTSTPSEC